MRRALKLIVIMALALIYPGVSAALPPSSFNAHTIASYPSGALANGIAGSKHNLGSFGTATITTDATTEICVFCHTPHHANTATGPLWNRGTPNASSYTSYGTTVAGTSITAVGGVSLACLSCHDGVTTIDNIVNAPGKGGVIPGGSGRGWTMYKNGNPWAPQPVNILNTLPAGVIIGTDLTNDHPVSVPYNSTVASLRPTNTAINGIDLTAGLAPSAAAVFGSNLTQNRWAIKGFISETATINDLLRNGKVECSSCHDPHFKNLSWDEVEKYTPVPGQPGVKTEAFNDGLFLRRVGGNTGSGLCRTCHNK